MHCGWSLISSVGFSLISQMKKVSFARTRHNWLERVNLRLIVDEMLHEVLTLTVFLRFCFLQLVGLCTVKYRTVVLSSNKIFVSQYNFGVAIKFGLQLFGCSESVTVRQLELGRVDLHLF